VNSKTALFIFGEILILLIACYLFFVLQPIVVAPILGIIFAALTHSFLLTIILSVVSLIIIVILFIISATIFWKTVVYNKASLRHLMTTDNKRKHSLVARIVEIVVILVLLLIIWTVYQSLTTLSFCDFLSCPSM